MRPTKKEEAEEAGAEAEGEQENVKQKKQNGQCQVSGPQGRRKSVGLLSNSRWRRCLMSDQLPAHMAEKDIETFIQQPIERLHNECPEGGPQGLRKKM